MNFQKDLAFGEKYQMELVKVLKPKEYKMSVGNFKPYDIVMTIGAFEIFYEVKACRLGHKTGNICIEYECSGKPSGISSTTADYYGYFIINPNNTYDLYVIPVCCIKSEIKKNSYHKSISGGDNNKSKSYLFNKNIFAEYLQ